MKPIILHPISLVAGAALAVLVSAQTATPIGPRPAATTQLVPVASSRIPAADMVAVPAGTSYTVPSGRAFVLTGVMGNGYLQLDGHTIVFSSVPGILSPTPPGLTAGSGSMVQWTNSSGSPLGGNANDVRIVALGYLD